MCHNQKTNLIGGMVNGIVTQTNATEMGRLARKNSATTAEIIICPGVGKYMPSPESIKENKNLQFLGDKLHDPNLWHLNRRSVAAAFAVGLFVAFHHGSVF
jgi:hypothetical protein